MKKFLLAAVLALFPGFSQAQNCSTPPTCASLGFIYTAAQCGSLGTKCPFDTSKYFCEHPNRNAAVGNYFFEDSTVSTSSSANGKTAIGVVIKAPSSGNRGVVVHKHMYKSSYYEADNYCRALTVRGTVGRWRLPTDSELSTLLGNSTLRSKLSILGSTIKTGSGDWYWSCSNKSWNKIWLRRGTNVQEHTNKTDETGRNYLCVGEF